MKPKKNSLATYTQPLENSTQIYSDLLPQSIALAFQRVNVEPVKVSEIAEDVKKAFPKCTENELIEAIRRGALGEFGRTYRMSTQEVCIWIREHVGHKPDKEKVLELMKKMENEKL